MSIGTVEYKFLFSCHLLQNCTSMDKKSTAACMAESQMRSCIQDQSSQNILPFFVLFYKTEINGCEPLMPFDRELVKWRFRKELYKEKKALEEITGESVSDKKQTFNIKNNSQVEKTFPSRGKKFRWKNAPN